MERIKRIANVFSRYSHPSDDFAAIVTYQVAVRNPVLRFLLRQAPVAPLVFRLPSLRRALCAYSTTERIVEVPFVLRHLTLPKGSAIADFGCTESPLALHLANAGYQVTGIDLRPYPFDHPNLRTIQGDVLGGVLPGGAFDAAICLSTIEHVGLDAYGGRLMADGDLRVMRELRRSLRTGGTLLLTVPYGCGRLPGSRVYDRDRLSALLEGFAVDAEEYYYKQAGRHWIVSDRETVGAVESRVATQGVALIAARKRD
ncbi:MAG: DUF268 domain-containing protein [Candidatus Omnitrophica bacterium]|nr:DUF268 domain-containing protein [Candidatus Omnitrophota bacterium]